MIISNIDVFESENNLYIKCVDGRLIHLSGEDIAKTKIVIDYLNTGGDIVAFKSDIISKQEVDEILIYLFQNGVLEKKDEERTTSLNLTIGFWGDNSVFESLKIRLKGLLIKKITNINDFEEVSFLLVSCPIFEYFTYLKSISDEAYKNNVIVLYCEIAPISFTIGPLSIPKQHTPSLGCYLQRKLVNTKDPNLFAKFIFSKEKTFVKKSNISDFPYYNASIEILTEEINRYFKYDGSASQHLIAKSMTINFFNYEVEKSWVLKDPTSSLFRFSPFTPFNG